MALNAVCGHPAKVEAPYTRSTNLEMRFSSTIVSLDTAEEVPSERHSAKSHAAWKLPNSFVSIA